MEMSVITIHYVVSWIWLFYIYGNLGARVWGIFVPAQLEQTQTCVGERVCARAHACVVSTFAYSLNLRSREPPSAAESVRRLSMEHLKEQIKAVSCASAKISQLFQLLRKYIKLISSGLANKHKLAMNKCPKMYITRQNWPKQRLICYYGKLFFQNYWEILPNNQALVTFMAAYVYIRVGRPLDLNGSLSDSSFWFCLITILSTGRVKKVSMF